jgi:hypothetical protein
MVLWIRFPINILRVEAAIGRDFNYDEGKSWEGVPTPD